ncbi:MAG: tetratricopeptide repeat protein, partial [Parcubacteria group bacterium]|nr:tetratricopeptide repeat protein [Parcubacteria group bacterium]
SAYKHLGWLYLENNKPMEARQAFKMAIKLGSRDKMIMAKLLEVGGVLHKEGTASHAVVSRTPTGKQDVPARTVTLKPVITASYSTSPSPKTTAGHSKVSQDRSNAVADETKPISLARHKKEAKPKTKKLKVRKV